MNNRLTLFAALMTSRRGLMVDYMAAPEADRKLRDFYGADSEKDLLDQIGSDFYYLSARDISQNESFYPVYKKNLPSTVTERVCSLGIRYRRGAYGSKFAVDEAIKGPLHNASTVKEILDHPFPKRGDFDFSPLQVEAELNADRIRIGGLWTGIMGDSYRMYGFERFLQDMAERPHLVHALIDRLTELYLDLNDRYFAALKGKLDIWFFGNDFGSQNGMMMSPCMWRDYFLENIRRLCTLARSYGLRTMMHSCGSIRPIIGDLIDAGVELLDPLQATARDMDAAELAADFSDRMVFHGGLDTQAVLPLGSPETVREESLRLMDVFAGKPYVFASSQILGPDIPVENMHAMYQAALSFRGRAT